MLKENLQNFLDNYYEERFNSIKNDINEKELTEKIISQLKSNLLHIINSNKIKIKLRNEKEAFYAFYKLKDCFDVEYFYGDLFFNKLKLN